MAIPQIYALATDGEFRLLAQLGRPPRAGRVASLLPSGQVTVDMDDPDGGTATAWPLNGFSYAVGDVVYVSFASDAADSGIVVGSKAPVPLVALASIPDALLRDGSRTLTADWDIGDNRRVLADGLRARDGAGLRLEDDAGNLGVFVEDGGQVGIGTASPGYPLDIKNTAGPYVLNVQSDDSNARPGIRMEARRPDDSGLAFSLFDAEVGKSTGSLIYAGRVGVLAQIANTSLGRYLFLDGSPDGAYNNATLKIDADDKVGIGLSGTTRPSVRLHVVGDQTYSASFMDGNVGIGTTTPQGALHVEDGDGYYLVKYVSPINSATPIVVIPNGAGDVTKIIQFEFVVTDGTNSTASTGSRTPGGAVVDVTLGTNTFRMTVNANGSVDVRRQAGTGTLSAMLDLKWI